MIELFGTAAEVFEESLASFAIKIALYMQRFLKELEPAFHETIATSMSKLVVHTLNKAVVDMSSVLDVFYSNFNGPNSTLQVGSATVLLAILEKADGLKSEEVVE